jgi:uncharacterized membrane protein YeaQ/YmgE (transglycosylase-associated protein family)
MGFIYLSAAGLCTIWLAQQVLKRGGYSLLVDTILCIGCGIVGGWECGIFGIGLEGKIIVSIVVMFICAAILVWFTHLLEKA